MRIFRRVLGWATFLGFLVAVGAMVFLEVRSRPRCTIAGDYRFLQTSPDGATVVTCTILRNEIPGNEAVRIGGPVQVWDTQTGQVRVTLLANAGYVDLSDAALSPDQRHITVTSANGAMHVLDCANGTEHSLDLGDHAYGGFSRDGAWLFARTTKETPTDFVIEVATRRVVLRPPRGSLEWGDFKANNSIVLLREAAQEITVWDLAAGKKVGVLPTAKGAWMDLSRDGRYFVNARFAGEAPADPGPLFPGPETDGMPVRDADRMVEIWDLTTLSRRYSHEYRHRYFRRAWLTANGRYAMICKPVTKDLDCIDVVETDKGHTVFTMPRESSHHDFSADGKLLCISTSKQRTAMIDLASGQTLWEKPGYGAVRFVGATGVVMYLDEKIAVKPSELLDVRTGERRAVVPLLSKDPSASGQGLDTGLPRLTPDCQHLLAIGMQQRPRQSYFWQRWLERCWPARFGGNVSGAAVMETSTGRVLFHVLRGVGDQQFLSNDVATLTTVENSSDMRSTVIRIWDIHPGRAWMWAFAAAMGIGVGLWSVRRGVGWLRGRRISRPKERVA